MLKLLQPSGILHLNECVAYMQYFVPAEVSQNSEKAWAKSKTRGLVCFVRRGGVAVWLRWGTSETMGWGPMHAVRTLHQHSKNLQPATSTTEETDPSNCGPSQQDHPRCSLLPRCQRYITAHVTCWAPSVSKWKTYKRHRLFQDGIGLE